MEKSDNVYLEHILSAIGKIEKYLKGISNEKFIQKDIVQDAVIRQLEIIGEASKHLSNELKSNMQSIPWGDVAGSRDILSHKYFSVDLDLVWQTTQEDLPKLKIEITKILMNKPKK